MERKAAIYLRVSTTDQNYERQRDELEATVKYEGYKLVKVYEEKKSAVLDMDTREELTKMRQLSKADVDAIFFWDVTRLSRKSIDFITLVEEFSNKGICLYFKNERLTTLQDNGEMHPMAKLQLYILGVFAQMDAENLKAKFKSGKERSLAIGNAYTANPPYGYKLKNKKLYIDEEEATIVRTFFDWYLEGKPLREIEMLLNSKNIPTRKGELWSKAMIIKMIKNPVYKGEPVYKNRNKDGEVIKERTFNAPIIIEPAKWELAQIELNRRKDLGYTYSYKNPFFAKLYCEDCGGYYGKKKWHSGSTYEREVLQCNDKFKNKCQTPTLDEDVVKRCFLRAYNLMVANKDNLLADLELVKKVLCDTAKLDEEINKLSKELEEMANEFNLLVKMNTKTQQDQSIWRKKYAELEDKYKNKESEYKNLISQKEERKLKESNINTFIETLKKGEILLEWDDGIFNFTLEKAIVHKDKSITFKFYTGFETTLKAEE